MARQIGAVDFERCKATWDAERIGWIVVLLAIAVGYARPGVYTWRCIGRCAQPPVVPQGQGQ